MKKTKKIFKTAQLLLYHLLRKSKSEYFGNLNEKRSPQQNIFGKPLSPFYRIK